MGFVVFSTVLLTGCAYLVMGLLLDDMSVGAVALSRGVVTGVALLVFVFFLVRRPQVAGNRIKAIFEMIADIAGFWPPDLVALAAPRIGRCWWRACRRRWTGRPQVRSH